LVNQLRISVSRLNLSIEETGKARRKAPLGTTAMQRAELRDTMGLEAGI
jgi:hypothetical protein